MHGAMSPVSSGQMAYNVLSGTLSLYTTTTKARFRNRVFKVSPTRSVLLGRTNVESE